MNNLIVCCLVAAYLAANIYAIVKVRVFELARSRKHLLIYGVPFILWALSSCWDASSWRSCSDSTNGPPDQAFPTEVNSPTHTSSMVYMQ